MATVPTYTMEPLFIKNDTGGVFLLDSLHKCVTYDSTSGESTLDFTLPSDDSHMSAITPEAQVRFKGKEYRIRGITHSKDYITGYTKTDVYCERLRYNLNYAGQVEQHEFSGADIIETSALVLGNSGWSIGRYDTQDVLNWTMEKGTVLGSIHKIAKMYSMSVVFHDESKTIDMVASPGRQRGTFFTYYQGIASATRRVDSSSLVTRIYGQNAEGATFADINGGKPYVEDFTYTNEVREATYDFQGATSPQAMLNYCQSYIKRRSRPRFSYEYTLRDLESRTEELQRFEIFDEVFILDEDFGSSVKARVEGLQIDWLDLGESKITLDSKLASLSGGGDNEPGGINASPISVYKDGKTNPAQVAARPQPPTRVRVASSGYWYGDQAWSSIRVTWDPVERDVNNAPVKIAYYLVETSGGKLAASNTSATEVEIDGIRIRTTVNVRVRAIAESGFESGWSLGVAVATSAPTTLLDPPTAPSLSSREGMVVVAWDGKLRSQGGGLAPAPLHLKHVVVEEWVTDHWEARGALSASGELVIPRNDAVGKDLEYRFISVDTSGQVGGTSTKTTVRVVNATQSSINQAMTDAKNALAEAKGAKTTADGKSRIYAQTSRPQSDAKAGDLWYKLDASGNITEVLVAAQQGTEVVWNRRNMVASSVLVPGSVGSTTIQDGAVTSTKIVADSALVSKLMTPELMAGRIQSSYLNANAIDGKTITGATVQSSASGRRTVLNSQGIEVFNAQGQSQVRLGFNYATGLAIADPKTGSMIEASGMIFGANSIARIDSYRNTWLDMAPTGNQSQPWRRVGQYGSALQSPTKRANIVCYCGVATSANSLETNSMQVVLNVHSKTMPSSPTDGLLYAGRNAENWEDILFRNSEFFILNEYVSWSGTTAYPVIWFYNKNTPASHKEIYVWSNDCLVIPA